MTTTRHRRVGGVLFVALAVRLLVVPFSIARYNPYAQADATRFATAAERTAHLLANGAVPPIDPNDVIQVWGAFLSPFWLFPGPSQWYAHVATVLLGVGAVYNVYVLTARFGSHRAGLLAAAVIAVLPSIVLVQASLLRDGAVMFGLTAVLRLWFASSTVPRAGRVGAAMPVLLFTYLLRTENAPLYALVGGAYVFFWLLNHTGRLTSRTLTLSGIIGGGLLASIVLPRATGFLSAIRANRARGDSTYLPEAIPTSAIELVAFAWVGGVYLLFAPFPWMVSDIAGLVVMWEGLLNLGFLVAAVYGVRRALQATGDPAAVLTLVAAFVVGSVLYGLANANYGAAVRQRQMFLPVLYLFGAIGITEQVDLRPLWSRASSSRRSQDASRSH